MSDPSASRPFVWPAALVAGSGLCALAAAWLAAGAIPPSLADKDFANYWIAARLVLSGGVEDLFGDHSVYFAHMLAAFGPDYPWHNWSYPPHYLLFVWPLGLFGYVPAMVLFLGLTLALYLAAARSLRLRADIGTAVMLAPFVLMNFWAAQNGFLTGAMMIGALALRHERPVLAGVLAGCLTVKPQLGLLLPVLFLIEGRWRVIAAAAVTGLALAALSASLFGVQSWAGYIQNTLPYQSEVMRHGTGVFLWMMPSVFGSLRSLSPAGDSGTALAAHLAFALPVLLLAIFALVRSADPFHRTAIAVLATMLVTPYWLAYDFGAAAAVLAALKALAPLPGAAQPAGRATGDAILAAAALTPMLAIPLGAVSAPVLPLVLLAAFLVVLARAGIFARGAAGV